jgi:hypothetical protein
MFSLLCFLSFFPSPFCSSASACSISSTSVDKSDMTVLDNINLDQGNVPFNLLNGESERAKLERITTLVDAKDAGKIANGSRCTLILTEGMSSLSFVETRIDSIAGRDTYGVFPLMHRSLNVRAANTRWSNEKYTSWEYNDDHGASDRKKL